MILLKLMLRSYTILIFLFFNSTNSFSSSLVINGDEQFLLETDRNCRVYVGSFEKRREDNKEKEKLNVERKWDGYCINGLIEGRGTFSTIWNFKTHTSEVRQTGFFRAGLPIGYSRIVSKSSSSSNPNSIQSSTTESWYYSYGQDRITFASKGHGVIFPEGALTSNTVDLPIFDELILKKFLESESLFLVSTNGISLRADLFTIYCNYGTVNAIYPECNDKTISVATYFSGSKSDPGVNPKLASKNRKVCPKITSFDGCSKVAFESSIPVQNEVLDFIKLTKPLVEEEMKKSNQLTSN